uniref:Ig-like domain-containing protein n=1 Tax=Tetraodon nigroviridis TaxID=99883 RepID=H3C774_TETNG
ILATSGDDVVLPCHLEPPESLEEAVVEWSRQEPTRVQYVHVYRDHGELTDLETASYRGRTALFPEELKRGNVSLKISGVSPADAGSYRCFV